MQEGIAEAENKLAAEIVRKEAIILDAQASARDIASTALSRVDRCIIERSSGYAFGGVSFKTEFEKELFLKEVRHQIAATLQEEWYPLVIEKGTA